MTKADRDALDAAMAIIETQFFTTMQTPPDQVAQLKDVLNNTLGRFLKDINCIADAAATTRLK